MKDTTNTGGLMFPRLSSCVGVVFLAATLMYGYGAKGDSFVPGQIGITLNQTSVYVNPEGIKMLRVLDPGTTLQVGGLQGKRLKVTLSRNDQTLDGWIDADDLLALDPASAYHRALAYQGARDAQQAVDAYAEAVETDKGNARVYYNRALLCGERNDPSGAILNCSEAVKIDAKFAEAYLARANAYAKQSDFDAALRDYAEAIKIRPAYALAYYNRSLVRHRWASRIVDRFPETAEGRGAGEGSHRRSEASRNAQSPASDRQAIAGRRHADRHRVGGRGRLRPASDARGADCLLRRRRSKKPRSLGAVARSCGSGGHALRRDGLVSKHGRLRPQPR